jgi:hypothetical protein
MMLAGGSMEMTKDPARAQVDAFKGRIGLDHVPDADAKDGVRANWLTLSAHMPKALDKLKRSQSDVYLIDRGMTELKFRFVKEPEFVSVNVFVSGVGPTQARERLASTAAHIMREPNPYQLGPMDLGDVSVEHIGSKASSIIWSFRNVCVHVETRGTSVKAESIARAVQDFMNMHVVADVSAYLPRANVVVSPKKLHVGAEVRVSVTLAKGTTSSETRGNIAQGSERLLEERDVQPFAASFQAMKPGTGRINVSLIDRKTLLSPDLGVEIHVAP